MKLKDLLNLFLLGLLVCAPCVALAEVKDASRAAAQDVNDANKFLSSLPDACGKSNAYATNDGRVTIKVICDGQPKGIVVLKAGKVIDLR